MTIKSFASKAWATRHLNAIIAEHADLIADTKIEENNEGRWFVVITMTAGAIAPSALLGQAELIGTSEPNCRMAQALNSRRQQYTITLSYSGRKSADTGDETAEILRGLTPMGVCYLADLALNCTTGTHYNMYEHLNPGQMRMNAGNRIRGLVRRGGIAIEDLHDFADSVRSTEP